MDKGKAVGMNGILAMVAAGIGLIIAIAFTVVYGLMLKDLDAVPESDRCVAYENYEYVEVYAKWRFVIEFGFGMWMAMIFVALIAMFAGCNLVLKCMNCCINCCLQVPFIVQTVFLGVNRYGWFGSTCSREESSFHELGAQMNNVFIAQCVCWYVYYYCNNCATFQNKQEWERKSKEWAQRHGY